jgi:hypothetical protein
VDFFGAGRCSQLLDGVTNAQQHRLADTVTNPGKEVDSVHVFLLALDARL